MSIEINNPLLVIEKTCGECPKRSGCFFGKPALKTLDTITSDTEKSIAITYIWEKRTELVIKGCPQTETIFEAVNSLKKS